VSKLLFLACLSLSFFLQCHIRLFSELMFYLRLTLCIWLIFRFAVLIIFAHWSMGGVAPVKQSYYSQYDLYVIFTLQFSVFNKQWFGSFIWPCTEQTTSSSTRTWLLAVCIHWSMPSYELFVIQCLMPMYLNSGTKLLRL
jgi:hypothetical protein